MNSILLLGEKNLETVIRFNCFFKVFLNCDIQIGNK